MRCWVELTADVDPAERSDVHCTGGTQPHVARNAATVVPPAGTARAGGIDVYSKQRCSRPSGTIVGGRATYVGRSTSIIEKLEGQRQYER